MIAKEQVKGFAYKTLEQESNLLKKLVKLV